MNSLIKLPSVTTMSDIRKVRSVFYQIESRVRGLQGLEVTSESYGNLLIQIMLNKIPEELKLIISRKFEKDDWNLDRLLKEFQSELEARERIAAVSKMPRATSSSIQNKTRTPFPTAAALLSLQEGKAQASKVSTTCSFCRQKHFSASCTVVTDVRARKNLLRAQRRYFLCLKRSHLSRC